MIRYLVGDATDPQVPGCRIIAHVCNDVGGWGRGFVLSLSQRYPEAELSYRRWFQRGAGFPPPELGQVVLVPVAPDTLVANMIGQHGVQHKDDGTPPIRYGAVEQCLARIALAIRSSGLVTSVHMPRIGCGLAGGKWSEIEPIVQRTLHDIDVYVYDFDTGDHRTVPWTP